MDIGIFIEYDNTVVQIPVNPQKFSVKTEGNNQTEEIIALGEIIIPRQKKLSTINWECFFPYEDWFPAIRTKGSFESAKFYIDFINKIRDACKPCHLTVTGIDFDDDVVIQNFDYNHQAGDHEDTYYSIEFKRYQSYNISKIPKLDALKKLKKPSDKEASPEPKQITIGCSVTLNGTVHYDSYGSKPGKTFTNYKGVVSLINKKGTHPYHITTPAGGWLGWVTKESVVLS